MRRPGVVRDGRVSTSRQRGLRAAGFSALAVAVGLATLPAAAQTTTSGAPTSSTTAPANTTTAPPTTAAASSAPATTAQPQGSTATTGSSSSTAASSTPPTSAGSATTAANGTTTSAAAQAKIEAAERAKSRQVNAANAQLGELTSALASVQSDIDAQSAKVEIATKQLGAAQAIASAAAEDVTELEATVLELEYGLSDQAIRSFKGEVIEAAVMVVGTDPNQAIRMQAMLAKATQSDIDYVNTLAGVREDLTARRADATEAVALAEQSQAQSEQELAELEADRAAQGELAAAAESRLDHLLSERAALARLGEESSAGADASQTDALVAQLASTPAPPPSSASRSSGSGGVTGANIRSAGKGIEVHVDIVDNVRRLLADAAAAGVDLAGGGYRDPAAQIATRRNNCGTSSYAIYDMPSSRCRPPTARPGRSQHEQGKAIDFTHNGRLIRSRSGGGWNWLKANAANYGLFNLPSEPWHWSVNGR